MSRLENLSQKQELKPPFIHNVTENVTQDRVIARVFARSVWKRRLEARPPPQPLLPACLKRGRAGAGRTRTGCWDVPLSL